MRVVREETEVGIPGIGSVYFGPFQSTRGTFWHENYGRTHAQDFRFTANGRDYWGTILRTFDKNGKPGERTHFDVELRTRAVGSIHSRALSENHKTDWRRALIQRFKFNLSAFVDARDAGEMEDREQAAREKLAQAREKGLGTRIVETAPETPAADAARAQADSDIETGKDVRVVGSIDLTPTWAAIVNVYILALECGTETGKQAARKELRRMAELADVRNTYARRLADLKLLVEGFHACKQIRAHAAEENQRNKAAALAILNGESDQ